MLRHFNNRVLVFAAWTMLVLSVFQPAVAQMQARTPTPNDTLISPEIMPNGRVTFRIYAPQAAAVSVRGDWMAVFEPVQMNKSREGVWSTVVGPLKPDYYSYTMYVDEVRTLDPKNPVIKQGNAGVDNMFFLPGEGTAFQTNNPVPHGQIRKVWYPSSTLQTQRRLHVYTPPGYDGNTDRYPVFYLLHGGGDEDSGWSTIGRAGFILDNLLANKQAVPMIIVMPNGSVPVPVVTPAADPAIAAARRARSVQLFAMEIVEDIVPFIEKNFRARVNPEDRALAGLSMGGVHTLQVISDNPFHFGHVGIWSAGLFNQDADEFTRENSRFLDQAEQINARVKLLSISVGSADFALDGSQRLGEVLDQHGISHEFHTTGGGHTWLNWRRYLHDFASALFR